MEWGNTEAAPAPRPNRIHLLSRQLLYPLPFALVGSREVGERYPKEFLYRAVWRVWERGSIFLMRRRPDWF